jgi:quercetin dioxygenase-like cupin family protein
MKRLGICLFCLLAATTLLGQQTTTMPAPSGSAMPAPHAQTYSPENLQWSPAPASMPAGAQVAVLEGDPKQSGPFTMRIKLPDGYTVPPHTHPAREHVTVLSGNFNWAMGDKLDVSKLQSFPVGSYMYMEPGTPHFVTAKGETVIQVNAIGPWAINYINPNDDPRRKQ